MTKANHLQLPPGRLREMPAALITYLILSFISTILPSHIFLRVPHSALLRNLHAESPTLLLPAFQQRYRGWWFGDASGQPGWGSCSRPSRCCCPLLHQTSTEVKFPDEEGPPMIGNGGEPRITNPVALYIRHAIPNTSSKPLPSGFSSCWWRLISRRSWGVWAGMRIGWLLGRKPKWWMWYRGHICWEADSSRSSPWWVYP